MIARILIKFPQNSLAYILRRLTKGKLLIEVMIEFKPIYGWSMVLNGNPAKLLIPANFVVFISENLRLLSKANINCSRWGWRIRINIVHGYRSRNRNLVVRLTFKIQNSIQFFDCHKRKYSTWSFNCCSRHP